MAAIKIVRWDGPNRVIFSDGRAFVVEDGIVEDVTPRRWWRDMDHPASIALFKVTLPAVILTVWLWATATNFDYTEHRVIGILVTTLLGVHAKRMLGQS